MNDFDKAARRTIQDAPADHIGWLFPNLAGRLLYDDWLESQSAPRPNDSDRRCDTIARLLVPQGAGPAWAAVIEWFTNGDPDALTRTARYVWTYKEQLRYGPDPYEMAAAMVFLTDVPTRLASSSAMPGGDSLFAAQPKVVSLAAEDALATMAAIRENRLGPGILPWIPLMGGGKTAAETWRTTALEKQPNVFRQREMAGLARVFSELAKCREEWKAVLEGFGMLESITLKEQRNEGRSEGQLARGRDDLTRLLTKRFKEALPPVLLDKVKMETRLHMLTAWFDAAIEGDLPTVQKAMGE